MHNSPLHKRGKKVNTRDIHKPMQEYASSILVKMNQSLDRQLLLQIEITDSKRGWSRAGRISVPTWAIERGFEYFTYYIIHEISHHIAGSKHGHDYYFKEIEIHWVKKLINCNIEYKKAYPKRLINFHSGKVVYTSK